MLAFKKKKKSFVAAERASHLPLTQSFYSVYLCLFQRIADEEAEYMEEGEEPLPPFGEQVPRHTSMIILYFV